MRVRQDRFGRPTVSVAMKDKKGRGFPSGVVRIGGTAYKLELSSSKSDGVEAWVNVTKLPPRGNGGGFGGGSSYGGGGYGGGQRSGGL